MKAEQVGGGFGVRWGHRTEAAKNLLPKVFGAIPNQTTMFYALRNYATKKADSKPAFLKYFG